MPIYREVNGRVEVQMRWGKGGTSGTEGGANKQHTQRMLSEEDGADDRSGAGLGRTSKRIEGG